MSAFAADLYIWKVESLRLRCVSCLWLTFIVGESCGALMMVILVGAWDAMGILKAASSRLSEAVRTSKVGELLVLPAEVDRGGVKARTEAMFALIIPF